MHLAIIGSRYFDDYDYFQIELETFLRSFFLKKEDITKIVSGGAIGADSLAKQYAKENSIEIQEFLPDYAAFGKTAPKQRNYLIIDNADKILAFWDHKSPGTNHALQYAKSLNKPIYIKDGWVDGYILKEFLLNKGTDHKNRKLDFILKQDNEWLEKTHDYIQYVFPNNIRSSFNYNAPIITEKQAAKLAQDKTIQESLIKSLIRFKDFFELDAEKPHWITPNNHNYLRLTRVLITCNLFKRYADANKLFNYLTGFYSKYPDIIGSTTFGYWERAAFTKYA